MANRDERLSWKEKIADDYAWFKKQADKFLSFHYSYDVINTRITQTRKMQVNYDLYNNRVNIRDFDYVMKPFGGEMGELPADFQNRDIVSGKINAILGMEYKRPFTWSVIATNPEATTRREQAEFGFMKDAVMSEIMIPIQQQLEMQAAQEAQGKELSQEEQQQIQQQIQEQLQAMTPPEVKRYMAREYQDPAEVLSQQLLEYLILKLDIERKFQTAFKHGLLSANEIGYLGIFNGEPEFWIVNPIYFNYDKSPDTPFIEESEFASCEYNLPPSAVIQLFNEELTEEQIDKLYQGKDYPSAIEWDRWVDRSNQTFTSDEYIRHNQNYIKVFHVVWKSLRKIGFLTYVDMETGEPNMQLVDEAYKMNPEAGDIDIEWKWIPEVYETWKLNDEYVRMRPIEGQHKDLDNLFECKLPYIGVVHDNLNSEPVSLMDRLKSYQYLFNIIIFRMEMLLYSDKGKKLLMNINAVPNSVGIDVKKWQYFFETTNIIWYNPNEEGVTYQDGNTIAREIDLSLVSQIQNYINFAEYIRTLAGRAVGITDQVEGQIQQREAVTNVKQSLVQSSNIIEPIFSSHTQFKRRVLQNLIDTAKVAYRGSAKKKLSYVLDDLSYKLLDLDTDLLDNNTYGIFVEENTNSEEIKETLKQMAFAALQNQQAELSDVIATLRLDSVVEIEEMLKLGEMKRIEREQQAQKAQEEAQQKSLEIQREMAREQHEMDIELAVVKEEERRKTVIIQASITGASFNPDNDGDNNGENDFLELAKAQMDDANTKAKLALERTKLDHQKEIDKQKMSNEREKIAIAKKKANSTSSKK